MASSNPQPLSASALLHQIPTSFATVSIGDSTTSLPIKLSAIASAGFQGIELGFPDLVAYASKDVFHEEVSTDDYKRLVEAGAEVKRTCAELQLKIMMLQPFANFEGWEEGSRERREAMERADGWIEVMRAVGTDMLQVGSSDSEGISLDRKVAARDLAILADKLSVHGFRLAYENWCWSTHAPDWADVWEIVKLADRPNIGLCLDTFQTAGGEWGDPRTSSGRLNGLSEDELDRSYSSSLSQLAKTVPKEKIYLLQLSDAYKPPAPLSAEPDESGLRPRGRWSHDFRPMPFDGGYLPIVKMTRAVLETGFRGWFSMEIFDGAADGKGRPADDLKAFAQKAMASHRRLIEEAVK